MRSDRHSGQVGRVAGRPVSKALRMQTEEVCCSLNRSMEIPIVARLVRKRPSLDLACNQGIFDFVVADPAGNTRQS